MCKCLNLNANILPKQYDIHNYYTRNNNEFMSPKCNMKRSQMSINFKSIKADIPSIQLSTSDSLFLNLFMDG